MKERITRKEEWWKQMSEFEKRALLRERAEETAATWIELEQSQSQA